MLAHNVCLVRQDDADDREDAGEQVHTRQRLTPSDEREDESCRAARDGRDAAPHAITSRTSSGTTCHTCPSSSPGQYGPHSMPHMDASRPSGAATATPTCHQSPRR